MLITQSRFYTGTSPLSNYKMNEQTGFALRSRALDLVAKLFETGHCVMLKIVNHLGRSFRAIQY